MALHLSSVEGIPMPANNGESFENGTETKTGYSGLCFGKSAQIACEQTTSSNKHGDSTNTSKILDNLGNCLFDTEYKCDNCEYLTNDSLKNNHNCILVLREVIEKQSSQILSLQDGLKKLRKYVRVMEKRILERETGYKTEVNEKLEILSANLDAVMIRDARRCTGRCRKHVKTEKCLCHGFTTGPPHVCCGKQGGVCDC